MRSFWSDPYLWIHLAGLAALPIWLELCFLGLAVGYPILPVWLELALVAIAGIAPILWMQWQRPFYIFSLLAIALKPENLTLPQRQLLTRFKSTQNRLLAVAVAVLLAIILRQLYVFAPIGTAVVPFAIESRGLGLLVAAIAFLASNLFLQVPISVASVMLTSDAAFASTEPYPSAQIAQDFTRLGLPVSQLLPEVVSPKEPAIHASATDRSIAPPIISSPAQPESAVEAVDLWADDLLPPLKAVSPSPTLESAAVESVVEESTEAISEVNGSALEDLILEHKEVEQKEVEIEAETVEAIAHPNDGVIDSPEVNLSTESDREVEQEAPEDLAAIARIDQSASEAFSTEASERPEPDPD